MSKNVPPVDLGGGYTLITAPPLDDAPPPPPPPDEPPAASGGRKRKPRARTFHLASDVELSEALMADLRREGLVAYDAGMPLTYDAPSGIWRDLPQEQLLYLLRSYDGAKITSTNKVLRLSLGQMESVTKLLRYELARLHPTPPGFLAGAPPGLCLMNGFVSVSAKAITLEPHSPDQRQKARLPIAYDPEAQAPRWGQFLWEVCGGAEKAPDWAERVSALQEFAGAALLGCATRYAKCMILFGEGANGKSVFLEVVSALFPRSCVTAIAPQSFTNEYHVAALVGSRLNAVNELPQRDVMESEAFKGIVDGKSTTGRHPRERPFDYIPIAAHLFAANALPTTTDHSHGFWRRFLVIPFTRVFAEGERNENLSEELIRDELPGILAWALAGGQRLIANGRYTEPQAGRELLADWKRGTDQVELFLEDHLVKTTSDEDVLPAAILYAEYAKWAAANGHKALNSTNFGMRAKKLLTAQRRSAGVVYYCLVRSKRSAS